MDDLKVALITGASRGIGRGIALELAAHKWSIVINYQSNEQAAIETSERVQENGVDCITVKADIGIPSDREVLVQSTIEKYGHIDLLVNNAGIAPKRRLDVLKTTEENYDNIMSVNLKGPFFLSQLVANEMIAGIQSKVMKFAKMINIGSISAYASSPNRAEYCISKAGMSMMTKIYADRLSEYGIHVYEIRPGVIETDMTNVVKQKYDTLIEEGFTPIKRWGQPSDVGKAVAAIAAEYLPFSTGEIINVDGGFHMRRLK